MLISYIFYFFYFIIMNKNVIWISSFVVVFVLAIISYLYVWANDDYTCYNFTTSKSACKYSSSDCSAWVNWKRTCNWIVTTKYTLSSSYACSTSGELDYKEPINSACSIEEIDNTPPTVTWGWIN